ncbi:hypothetical protein U1839_01360 [Sphingomonas sp. RT2P30]|uniref:hypothetical protein n=1 Tax=Parasphingomonas halimpatiens TaxID=3096162 RepID=UPI002FC8D0C4
MKKFFALAAVLAFVPCAAMAQDGDATLVGVRAEARIGYETPTISDSGSIYKIGSAVSYGGELGFDFKLGKTVQAGPYAVTSFRASACATAAPASRSRAISVPVCASASQSRPRS